MMSLVLGLRSSSNYKRTRRLSGRSAPFKRWSTRWQSNPSLWLSTQKPSRNSRRTTYGTKIRRSRQWLPRSTSDNFGTTKEKLAIQYHLLTPWNETPEAHGTTFFCQLYSRHVKCKYRGVNITNDNKVNNFAAQMYACGLFKAKLLDDW